ncbi:hypothetical protein JB92DRAFT_3131362 [Gautieria morchelliformis]|nr:hypothetical protein JB92DRAFT_3131362 [Gautieria morchelliformis]
MSKIRQLIRAIILDSASLLTSIQQGQLTDPLSSAHITRLQLRDQAIICPNVKPHHWLLGEDGKTLLYNQRIGHPSPIHTLLHTFNLKPGGLKTIRPVLQIPNQPPWFTTEIADSREELKEANIVDEPDAKVYTDGLGVDDNAGAAAVLYKQGRRTKALRYCLGLLADHTTYEAEDVGVTLMLELLARERGIKKASVLLDNQAVIQSISHVNP